MCVAVPMKVVSREGDRAVGLLGDTRREVGLALLPDVEVGDYVIVHAGYAIQRLDEEEARRTLELIAELLAAEDGGGAA